MEITVLRNKRLTVTLVEHFEFVVTNPIIIIQTPKLSFVPKYKLRGLLGHLEMIRLGDNYRDYPL